jgi:hypothetical protein
LWLAEAGLKVEEGAEQCHHRRERPVADLELEVADEGVVDKSDSCGPYHHDKSLEIELLSQLRYLFTVTSEYLNA